MLELSKQDAADIVNQLSQLINMKINIVNSKSIIIANSNVTRVGDFHEATQQIIDNNLTELIVDKDNQFAGTHSGTNLPIVIDNEIIGVVGITGEVKTAMAYGQIIKKMCEILIQIKERDILIEKRKIEKELFEIEWICNKATQITDSFISEGNSYNINIILHRRILVFSTLKLNNEDINIIIKIILLNDKNNIAFKNKNMIIAAITNRSNKNIIKLLDIIKSKINNPVKVGVDDQVQDLNINNQYLKACKALQTFSSIKKDFYIFYEDLFIELLEDDISLKRKREFILKVFNNYSDYSKIKEAINILKVYYDNDGSLKTTSEILGMHPNTLQYQLKKIYSKTNLDPRKLDKIGIFSLAIKFCNDVLTIF